MERFRPLLFCMTKNMVETMMKLSLKHAVYCVFIPLIMTHSYTSLANTCQRPINKHRLSHIACPYEGLSKVEKRGKVGFVDLAGNIIIPIIYDDASSFSEGLAEVELDNQTAFIDHQGQTVFTLSNDIQVLSDFKEGLLVIKQNGKIGFMDKTGSVAIKPSYDNASEFRENLAVVVIDGKWGFIDKTGKIVIKTQYDEAHKFFGGLAGVRMGDTWGAINPQGELVIPMIYDFIGHFKDNIADAKLDGEWLKIDKQGNRIDDDNPDYNQGIRHQKILNIINKNRQTPQTYGITQAPPPH